jgi:radical SAM superfamily enzyme YgiQ (UPF0313 family)
MLLLLETIMRTGSDVDIRYPPLQLAYLATQATACGFDTVIARTDGHDIAALLARTKPRVVGITTVSQNFDVAVDSARNIKRFDPTIVVVVGGHHITALPESLSTDMDVAVLGEGENTFRELLGLIAQGHFEAGSLERVNGIAFRRDNVLVRTGPRLAVRDLDDLPAPRRDLVAISPQDTLMFTSRGCPFHCMFCSSAGFWNTVRYHSPERVVAEIRSLVDTYGARQINIFDDLFAMNRARLCQIADLLAREPFVQRKKLAFACLARASVLNDEVVKQLRRINVHAVAIGFESGSERVLQMLKGGSASVETSRRAVESLRAQGISVVGSFIIGSPTETLAEAQATLGLIEELRLDDGEAYLAVPYPGTRFWDYALQRGCVNAGMPWRRLRLNRCEGEESPVLINDQMSASQIFGLLDDANAMLKSGRHKKAGIISRLKRSIPQRLRRLSRPAAAAE